MSELAIERTDKGWQVVESSDAIHDKRPVGPPWPTGAEARYWYDTYRNTPRVSPLRSPAESSSPVIEVSAGDPRGSSPDTRTVG